MAMKIIGWIIVAIIFFGFIAIIAAVCFMMPHFEDKNEDERLFNPDVNMKSVECEPKFKKDKSFNNSNQSVTRLPSIILHHFQGGKKNLTGTTRTTKKTTPSTVNNFKNITDPTPSAQNWWPINKTEHLYPNGGGTQNPSVKEDDKVKGAVGDPKPILTLPPTTSTTTIISKEEIDDSLPELELAEPEIPLIAPNKKLMKKRDSDN